MHLDDSQAVAANITVGSKSRSLIIQSLWPSSICLGCISYCVLWVGGTAYLFPAVDGSSVHVLGSRPAMNPMCRPPANALLSVLKNATARCCRRLVTSLT
jgi:hypothetical protein